MNQQIFTPSSKNYVLWNHIGTESSVELKGSLVDSC